MNPLVSSLTRPPQPLPRRHRHHLPQVNLRSLNLQIQKVTGVKRRRNTAHHTETNGEENGESFTKNRARGQCVGAGGRVITSKKKNLIEVKVVG